ncbi:Hypothetical protein SMAX5B_004881, partial [Scophthalmus maximus]
SPLFFAIDTSLADYSSITIMAFTSSSFLWANPLSGIAVRLTCSRPGKRFLLDLLLA